MRNLWVGVALLVVACAPHRYVRVDDDPTDQALHECQYEAQRQMAQDNRNYGWSTTLIENRIVGSCMRAKGYR